MRTALFFVLLLLAPGVVSAQNLIPLPTFASNYLTQWAPLAGSQTWSHSLTDNTGADGSGTCTATEPATCRLQSACFPVAPSTTYAVGTQMTHTGNMTSVNTSVFEYPSAGCSGGGSQFQNTVLFSPPTAWTTQGPFVATTSATAVSAQIFYILSATNTSGNTFTVNTDGAFFGIGLTPVELQQFSVE